jgi:hypothetical protein
LIVLAASFQSGMPALAGCGLFSSLCSSCSLRFLRSEPDVPYLSGIPAHGLRFVKED